MQDNSSKSSMFGIFLTGAALGMATAMLVAPKSGSETRKDLMNNFNQAKNKLRDKACSFRKATSSKLNQALETTKTVASESTKAAKEAKQRVKDQQNKPQNSNPAEPLTAEVDSALKAKARGEERR